MTLKNEITVPVSEWNVSGGRIPLGYVGDSNVEKVIFSFDDELPPAVYTIEIRSRRLTGIELLTVEDKALVFNVSADILVHSGSVDLQIVATAEGKTIRHTNIFAGYVYGSIQADGKVPEAEISLFQQALLEYNSKLQQAITAAETAQTSAEESAGSAQQAQTSAGNAQLSAQLANTYQTLANTAVVHASEYAGRAEDAAEAAEQSADKSVHAVADAGEYAAEAKDSSNIARTARNEAVDAASNAQAYAGSASEYADKAKLYEETAAGIRDDTTLFFENTVKFTSDAQTYAGRASDAKDLAEEARTRAESARDQAEGFSLSAEEARDDARESLNDAYDARTGALEARDEAELARDQAVSAMEDASSARTAAESARDEAERAHDMAKEAEINAESSRDVAETAREQAERMSESASEYADRAQQSKEDAERIATDLKRQRVVSLDDTAISSISFETSGIPTYVTDVSAYAAYGITETGWYSFARVSCPADVTVSYGFSISGADGYIRPAAGSDHVDIAVKYDVAAESKTVVINWGSVSETFVFRSTDLAVRNLDYRVTYYVYDMDPYCEWTYGLVENANLSSVTSDKTKFSADIRYYTKKPDGTYQKATVTTGATVPSGTYYVRTKLVIRGFTKNVSYFIDYVDCPIQLYLPDVDTANSLYGSWFEIQATFWKGTKTIEFVPSAGVTMSSKSTGSLGNGTNIINVQYGARQKVWHYNVESWG